MNVLVVSSYFDTHRGGLEIVAGRLAEELAGLDCKVRWTAADCVPPKASSRVATHGIAALNVAERWLGFPYPVPGLRGFARLLEDVRWADAVIVHDSLYATSIAAVLFSRRMRKPVALIQHIGLVPYKNPVLRLLMMTANATLGRWTMGAADAVVFISEFVRQYFSRRTYRRRPETIFNGVDSEVFHPASLEARKALRDEFGAPSGVIALFVGRFVEKKGLGRLERAAAMRPDIHWWFAGWGPIDPESWALDNVRVFKDLSGPGLARLYRAADVLVLPSEGEGFPLVIQEALATGIPVVCGDEIKTADAAAAHLLETVAISGRSPDDVARSCIEAIERALAADSDERRRDRSDFAQERYAWPSVARKYKQLLLSLTSRP